MLNDDCTHRHQQQRQHWESKNDDDVVQSVEKYSVGQVEAFEDTFKKKKNLIKT